MRALLLPDPGTARVLDSPGWCTEASHSYRNVSNLQHLPFSPGVGIAGWISKVYQRVWIGPISWSLTRRSIAAHTLSVGRSASRTLNRTLVCVSAPTTVRSKKDTHPLGRCAWGPWRHRANRYQRIGELAKLGRTEAEVFPPVRE